MRRLVFFTASALAALGIGFAFAASDTLTQSHAGETPPLTLFDVTAVCDACMPDDPYQFFGGTGEGDIGLGFNIAATVKARYEGNTDTVVEWTPGLLRQGSTLDTSDTLTTLPGTAKIIFNLIGTFGIFDKPSGSDPSNWDPVSGETTGINFDYTQNITCTLPLPGEAPRVCSKTDPIDLISINLIVDLTLRLNIHTDITLNSNGVVTVRKAEIVGGQPIADENITFVGTSPSTVEDPIFITCTQPAGQDMLYALTGTTWSSPNTEADYSAQFSVLVEEPVTGIDIFEGNLGPAIPIANLALGTLTTTAPDMEANLGPVLADVTPPTINSTGGPYAGVEGTAITFTADAEDNCGEPILRWDFSDGGVAYGNNVQHTFVDDGVYSVLLTAIDVTGLQTMATTSATVSNVTPLVDAGPVKSYDWGVPVPFHANGSDEGLVDNGVLLYSWDFDDPNDPLGSVGQDVAHTYAQPGTSDVVVTVMDKDGASSTDSVQVTVTKRDTSVSYNGATFGRITDTVALRASLVDEYGAPVVGRTVNFQVGGVFVGSGLTNAFGVATFAWAIPEGQTLGASVVDAYFVEDGMYKASTVASSITVDKELTVLTISGPFQSKPAKAVTLSAKLTDDEGNPIEGKNVDFALGDQTCNGLTDSAGIASCEITKLNQKPGLYPLSAIFATDPNYFGSADVDTFQIGN